MKTYFAADLGATSGRTILGTLSDSGEFRTEELTRFNHPLIQTGGHYYWDIFLLYNEILRGLREVAQRGITLCSIGIDTWGVDSVCIGTDGGILRNPRAYRDPANTEAMAHYLENVRTRQQLYNIAGTEILYFNSIFQYHAMQREGDDALRAADGILFMPDALSYMLTGERVCERSIASTSGMLNAQTSDLDTDLLASVGLRREQFGRMVQPGEVIGTLTPEVQQLTGLGDVPVVAVAGHDTQSAIAAIPTALSPIADNENYAYLSSGTWSLMGIVAPTPIINERSYTLNFTNEAGLHGTTCFLKNLCGMWLLESCRKQWEDQSLGYAELIEAAKQVQPFRSIIYPDAPDFAAPSNMVDAIQHYCQRTQQPIPTTPGEITRCIFDSLTLRYREVLTQLQEFSHKPIRALHVIGGGSKNDFLNQLTANVLGIPVVAGPAECTALGNLQVQVDLSQTDSKNSCTPLPNCKKSPICLVNSQEVRTFAPANEETPSPAEIAEWSSW